jgi:hypothetical protein
MNAKKKRVVARNVREADRNAAPTGGLGVLCPEAQADGVPCAELGRDCEICGKAYRPSEEETPETPIETF